jgi:TLD
MFSPNHHCVHHHNAEDNNDDNIDDDDDDTVIASSTAIMGENVIDSPTTQNIKTRFYTLRDQSTLLIGGSNHTSATSVQQQPNNGWPLVPNIQRPFAQNPNQQQQEQQSSSSTSDDRRAQTSTNSISESGLSTAATTTMTAPISSDENTNAMSVGIMAQGLAWARMQRNRRQRHYLQHQAEQQLRKIRLAQKVELQQQQLYSNNQQASSTDSEGRSLFENATFQSLMRLGTTKTNPPSKGIGTKVRVSEYYPDGTQADTGVVITSQSDVRHRSHVDNGAACDDDTDDENSFCISKSGVGYSVELPTVVDGLLLSKSPTHGPNKNNDDNDDDTSWIPHVRIEDEESNNNINACPYLLSADEMYQIAIHILPRNIVYCKWKRLYSLARDGDSFDACLRAIDQERQTLLVVRTAKNDRFGGYADAPWEGHGMQGSANYCGGPESCLFRIVQDSNNNDCRTDANTTTAGKNDDNTVSVTEETSQNLPSHTTTTQITKVICYRWTGANRYIQLCDAKHKMLAFGGGGMSGAFGLCIEQDFQYGSTGMCATFDNEPLCDEEQFQIVDLEIYGFLLGQF